MKAIILDMDGVIIDSEPKHFEIEMKLLEELGGSISVDKHKQFVGTTDYYMWDKLKNQFNIKMPVEYIIDIKRERFNKSISSLSLIPNFMDFIESVYNKDFLIALASSNTRSSIDKVIKSFKLDKYLNYSISAEEVKNGKPDPELFLKCAEILDIKANNCLVIEDSEAGVEAAMSANMKCIGLRSNKSQNLAGADLVIDNFNEINIDIINKIFK